MKIFWILALLVFTGCATAVEKDYAKISNQQACGAEDCGKDPR